MELGDVAGPISFELWERLQVTTTWRDRFAACDDVLGRLATAGQPPRQLERAWRTLVDSAGTMPIGDLASAVGYSRQHLTRRFRDEFGLAPKLAARVIRFDRARHMLMAPPSFVTIGQVAAACGYADHAHLVREFQSLAGCTPDGAGRARGSIRARRRGRHRSPSILNCHSAHPSGPVHAGHAAPLGLWPTRLASVVPTRTQPSHGASICRRRSP